MHFNKRNKRKIFYFVITLGITLVVGLCFLGVYMHFQNRTASALASNKEEALEEIVTDESSEIDEPENKGSQVDLPEIGEIAEIPEIEDQEETGESEADSQTLAAKGEAVLTFGGDVCFYDAYSNMNALSSRGGKIESCISTELLSEMRDSDVCMVNNEFPYSDRGEPLQDKAFAFRSRPENVHLLSDMGVDIVSIANNHAYDYGEEAFLDTLDTLTNDPDVVYIGGGKNLGEASTAAYFNVNGLKIGYLAATQIERLDNPDTKAATETQPGVMRCFNEKELDNLLKAIETAKKECDFLVAYIHWGTENTDVLDWAQPYQANLISKAGADLIVGSHPHCLQGVDYVNDVPVIYSLGNYWFNSKPLDTALLKVTVNADGIKNLQIIPARQENCTTSILHDTEKQRVLTYLQSLSQNVTIDNDGLVKR